MAYPNGIGPTGLVPVNLIGGRVYNGAIRQIPIKSGYAQNIGYGDFVTYSGAGIAGLGGNITSSVLTGTFQVSVQDEDNYTITVGANANATDVAGSPGGGTVVTQYEVTCMTRSGALKPRSLKFLASQTVVMFMSTARLMNQGDRRKPGRLRICVAHRGAGDADTSIGCIFVV